MRIEPRFRPNPFRTHDPRQYSAHPDRIPVSLAAVTVSEITDHDIGLAHDPKAQQRAEAFVRAALSFKVKQAERAEIAAARSALVASTCRTLIRIASEADDADDLDMVPLDAEMVAVGSFQ